MLLSGHKNVVTELHWTADGTKVVSCSPDKMVMAWDAEVGKRIRKWTGHTSHVNSCGVSRAGESDDLIVSGGDDGLTKIWDLRVKMCQLTIPNRFQITATAFGDSRRVYSSGLDNRIRAWDLRKPKESVMELAGHQDTVTGLSVSKNGHFLLSNSMDNSVRAWDLRPFCAIKDRCARVFRGARHGSEKMLLRCAFSPDGSKVAAGSSDSFVCIWSFDSGKLIYRLPGHKGSVNEVVFHPTEPIIGSCSSDTTIYLGEIAY